MELVSLALDDGEQALADARDEQVGLLQLVSEPGAAAGRLPEKNLDALPLVVHLPAAHVAQLGRAGRADAAQRAVDALGRRAILSDATPNPYALHYERVSWRVRNLLLVPHFKGFLVQADRGVWVLKG